MSNKTHAQKQAAHDKLNARGQAMITVVSIRNFKSLRDVQIDLERFTVFVGPNASGKSSILQGLDLLCQAFHLASGAQPSGGIAFGGGPIRDVETEALHGLSRGSKNPVELSGEVGGKWYRYRPHLPPTAPQYSGHGTPWDGTGFGVATSPGSNSWKQWQPEPGKPSPLPLSVLLRLEASNLVEANLSGPDPTAMTPDGTGLHAALASMALNDPDSWQALQADLRRIIPTIRRLRHTKEEPRALLFDTVGADSLHANQVSEGTLLVLGLLAALHAPSRPDLVLLDDLDRGLHPKAQKELITLLRGLLKTNSDFQILATTHSPYMLDSMETSEVRMTYLRDDGATVCAALTSHPKFPKWKDEMTPGEMWSLFGEKWLAEEVAA